MSETETWTVGRLLKWTESYLREKGVDNPRLDAEVLLSSAKKCQRIELYTSFEEETSEALRSAFRELVRRRAEGVPVAYLVGHREFYSLDFIVTPDVLIPRPETEFVLVRLLDLAPSSLGAIRIADVGTGSGILAVCTAKNLTGSQITAIDIQAGALKVARLNAERHGVLEQITFVESDLFSQLAKLTEPTFDFIISNPPYIRSDEMSQLPHDVGQYEPQAALHGGADGLDVIRRLVSQAPSHLVPGGWLILEVGPSTHAATKQLLESSGRWKSIHTQNDLANHPRVLSAHL